MTSEVLSFAWLSKQTQEEFKPGAFIQFAQCHLKN